QECDTDRQQHDVQSVHLAEVEDVEERADPGSVHGVLGVYRDELRSEVLLREVSGEGGENADAEDDHADHPCRGTTVPPAGHEVLAPEMKDHREEEQLHRPEVEAVEEQAE